MHTTYYGNRRGGHCPTHVRDTFFKAIDAYLDAIDAIDAIDACAAWEGGEPSPLVDFRQACTSLTNAAGLVWNCNDILPRDAISVLEEYCIGLQVRRWTYAAAGRALAQDVRVMQADIERCLQS